MKASETRNYIIDKSYCLFLCRSYEAVSISDISKAIGFTKGALYHHFSSKQDLFKAVIDRHLDMRIKAVDDVNITVYDYIEKVIGHSESVVNHMMHGELSTSPLNYFALYIDAFRHYPKFIKAKGDFIQNEIGKLEKIIEHAIEQKEIRDDIDIKVTATNIFSLSMGMVVDLLHTNSTEFAISTLRSQLLEYYKLIKL